jgi:centromeric protein E
VKWKKLNAQKKEVVDTDALIERYRKEIEDLKNRLAEREAEVPVRSRRLSAREVRHIPIRSCCSSNVHITSEIAN